jgi:hypothetical protein
MGMISSVFDTTLSKMWISESESDIVTNVGAKGEEGSKWLAESSSE